MPRKVVIRTRKSRTEIRATIAKIVAQELVAYGVQNVLRENIKDFIKKSAGGADREGTKWEPLKRKTILRKLRNKEAMRGARGQLRRTRKKFVGPKAIPRGTVPINIEFQDMIRSIKPGKVSGGRYIPPSDQTYRHTKGLVVVSTEVEHAARASKMRPIMASNSLLTQWMREGMAKNADKVGSAAKRKL